MIGTVERVEENRSQQGEAYWSLSISGRWYTAWDGALIKDVRPGSHVDFVYVQSGRFRKIIELRPVSSQASQAANDGSEQRLRRVTRITCLRLAAQLVESQRSTKAKEALKVAALFEQFIYGRSGKDSDTGKVTE